MPCGDHVSPRGARCGLPWCFLFSSDSSEFCPRFGHISTSAIGEGKPASGGVYGARELMCGIVGYVGPREATDVVIGGLQRLEYRGYDSAGIAIVHRDDISIRRSVGKLARLKTQLHEKPARGHQGIGHTRWATHGGVTENNAHPHRSQNGDIVVIQNGIVENYLQLKQ